MTDGAGGSKLVQRIKYTYSSLLLIFCIVIVMGCIFTEQTELSHKTHPAVAFFVLWIAIIWLTMVEGGQGAIVGLGPVKRELYKESHPNAYRCISIVHKGDNLDRYLLGRQFMVILIVFTVETAGAAGEAELWGFPQWIINMFCVSGIAMILFTCMAGQLNSEINGCHCMLDYSKYFLLYLLILEATPTSPLTHLFYLILLFFLQSTTGSPSLPSTLPWALNSRVSCTFATSSKRWSVTLLASLSKPRKNQRQWFKVSFSGDVF